ncbi:hypothetical protein L210DRAFT_3502333 [Boletus edulis BED1]|uniref:Uncharacterized protein n=1 Tax=Boletus edulis BED1 TaxID=1328754 RepID=A0AAD4C0A6_BOLED|nr:hypothetical protein L210DRAFT_3502333 [Boletus edulis BED1]
MSWAVRVLGSIEAGSSGFGRVWSSAIVRHKSSANPRQESGQSCAETQVESNVTCAIVVLVCMPDRNTFEDCSVKREKEKAPTPKHTPSGKITLQVREKHTSGRMRPLLDVLHCKKNGIDLPHYNKNVTSCILNLMEAQETELNMVRNKLTGDLVNYVNVPSMQTELLRGSAGEDRKPPRLSLLLIQTNLKSGRRPGPTLQTADQRPQTRIRRPLAKKRRFWWWARGIYCQLSRTMALLILLFFKDRSAAVDISQQAIIAYRIRKNASTVSRRALRRTPRLSVLYRIQRAYSWDYHIWTMIESPFPDARILETGCRPPRLHDMPAHSRCQSSLNPGGRNMKFSSYARNDITFGVPVSNIRELTCLASGSSNVYDAAAAAASAVPPPPDPKHLRLQSIFVSLGQACFLSTPAKLGLGRVPTAKTKPARSSFSRHDPVSHLQLQTQGQSAMPLCDTDTMYYCGWGVSDWLLAMLPFAARCETNTLVGPCTFPGVLTVFRMAKVVIYVVIPRDIQPPLTCNQKHAHAPRGHEDDNITVISSFPGLELGDRLVTRPASSGRWKATRTDLRWRVFDWLLNTPGFPTPILQPSLPPRHQAMFDLKSKEGSGPEVYRWRPAAEHFRGTKVSRWIHYAYMGAVPRQVAIRSIVYRNRNRSVSMLEKAKPRVARPVQYMRPGSPPVRAKAS